VGTAGTLPASIDRIAKWAKAAEGRSVLIVPITAVVAKAKPRSRQPQQKRLSSRSRGAKHRRKP